MSRMIDIGPGATPAYSYGARRRIDAGILNPFEINY